MFMNDVHVIPNVLSAEQLLQVHAQLQSLQFADGKNTAFGMAKSVKNNQQLTAKQAPQLIQSLAKLVTGNRTLRLLSQPSRFTPPMVSHYGEGMSYGTHTDSAVIQGVRGDLSYTLFLAEPSTYDGGELALETPLGEQKIKLSAGSLVLYHTGVLHRVAPVTRGARLAAVGWIQSRIRDPRQRQTVIDLELVRAMHLKSSGHDRAADLLLKVSHNLRRMWEE